MAAYRRHTDDEFYEEPYDEEFERRQRARAQREEELRRYEERQRASHRVRRPSQGTWYEQSAAQGQQRQQRGPGYPNGRGQQRADRRYDTSRVSDSYQHRDPRRGAQPARQQRPPYEQQSRRAPAGYQQQQRQRQQRPPQNKQYHVPRNAPLQPVGSLGGNPRSASAGVGLAGRPLLIAAVIVLVLLVIFVFRFATFNGGSELAAATEQVTVQQTKLDKITAQNANLQSQIDGMQSTLDKYADLVKSQS